MRPACKVWLEAACTAFPIFIAIPAPGCSSPASVVASLLVSFSRSAPRAAAAPPSTAAPAASRSTSPSRLSSPATSASSTPSRGAQGRRDGLGNHFPNPRVAEVPAIATSAAAASASAATTPAPSHGGGVAPSAVVLRDAPPGRLDGEQGAVSLALPTRAAVPRRLGGRGSGAAAAAARAPPRRRRAVVAAGDAADVDLEVEVEERTQRQCHRRLAGRCQPMAAGRCSAAAAAHQPTAAAGRPRPTAGEAAQSARGPRVK